MIKLSIITPTYNSIQFIESCILHIISQNCNQIEHIIVDGASTDGTVEVIQKYAELYNHIKWISEPDTGQSNAMNKGVKMAKGELIGFLNVDDYYEKNVLNHILSVSKHSNSFFYSGNCNVWAHDNSLLYVSKPKDNTLFSCYFRETYPVNPSSYFYKKEVHTKIGLYDETDHYCMDLEFFLRYMNEYKSYYYEDLIWGNFRVIETCKTFKDNAAGNMMRRKKELFTEYWKKNSPFLRYWLILKHKFLE